MWEQYHMRKEEHIERARQRISVLSQNMSMMIERTVEVADQLLKRVMDRQYTNLLFGGNLREDVRYNVALWAEDHPWVEAVLITDTEKKVDVTYTKHMMVEAIPGNVLDAVQERLKQLDSSNTPIFFSTVMTTENQKPTKVLVMARKMEEVNGTFKGMVAVVMNGNTILHSLQQMVGKEQGRLALLLENKDLIIPENMLELQLSDIQHIVTKAHIVPASTTQLSAYIGEHTISGKRQLVAVQSVASLPVVLLWMEEEQQVLAAWHNDMISYYQWVACLAAILLLAGCVVVVLLSYCRREGERAKKFQQLMQGKSHYFVKASEKLVTPIHAITGFSQMLAEEYFGQMNKEQKQRLQDIQQCSNQVLESVGHISELISADMGMIQLQEEQVDITSVIHGCMQLFAGKLVEQKMTLIDQTLKYHVMIQADSRRIRQMILHLLSNAIQYTPVGGKITLSTFYDNQQNFVCEVCDSGEGISKSELKKILHPFDREEAEDKDAKKVSIGLPLCQLYALLHGGKLEIKSKIGGGTKITVTIPKQRVIEQRTQVYGTSTAKLVA